MNMWRTLLNDMAELQRLNREIRACSDRSFAEVTGRPGTGAELRRFYRTFKQALDENELQRQKVWLASIKEQTELYQEQLRSYQHKIEPRRPERG